MIGINIGSVIPTNSHIKGNVSSARGSRGDATGSITIQRTNTGDTFTLDYNFDATGLLGRCPCTVTPEAGSIFVGNFEASPLANTRQCDNNDAASLEWLITNV